MALKFKGKVWVFGDNLDVDNEIFPFFKKEKGLVKNGEEWKYVMTNVDPDFPNKVKEGDILVVGTTMGCGHGHTHGLMGFIQLGISCIIAESFARAFFRGCIDNGMPIIEYPGIKHKVGEGDELEVDLHAGVIKNLTTKQTIKFTPLTDFLLEILEAGGLDRYGDKLIAEGVEK